MSKKCLGGLLRVVTKKYSKNVKKMSVCVAAPATPFFSHLLRDSNDFGLFCTDPEPLLIQCHNDPAVNMKVPLDMAITVNLVHRTGARSPVPPSAASTELHVMTLGGPTHKAPPVWALDFSRAI